MTFCTDARTLSPSKGPDRHLDTVDIGNVFLGDGAAGHDGRRLFIDAQDRLGLHDHFADLTSFRFVLRRT